MKTKEKAKELVDKYLNPEFTSPIFGVVEVFEHAKEFALIAVDEILDLDEMHFLDREYWEEVKTEIEKL